MIQNPTLVRLNSGRRDSPQYARVTGFEALILTCEYQGRTMTSRNFLRLFLCCLVAALAFTTVPSFAADQIRLTNKTNGATVSWNTSGFWTNQTSGGTGIPTSAQDAL